MADLDSLIRYRRHAVEEKQKVLATLFRQVELYEEKKKELYARLKKEREALNDIEKLETRDFYGLFEGVIRGHIEKIDAELRKLDAQIKIAQEEVREAFADMKRVEIVDERRKKEEAQEIVHKENQELDEIGLDVFRRQE